MSLGLRFKNICVATDSSTSDVILYGITEEGLVYEYVPSCPGWIMVSNEEIEG